MKKLTVLLLSLFAFSTTYPVLAAPKDKAPKEHGMKDHGMKDHEMKDHEMTVGNEKAAESGKTADDKTAKPANMHKQHNGTHKKAK